MSGSAGISGMRSGPVTHRDVDKEGSIGDKNPLSEGMNKIKDKAEGYALKMFNAMEESRWKAIGIAILILALAALFTFVIMPHMGWDPSNPSLGSAMMPIIGGALTGLGLYGVYCALVGKKMREKFAQQENIGNVIKGVLGLGLVGFGAWAIVASGVGHGWGGNGWFYIGVAAASLAGSVLAVAAYSKIKEVEISRRLDTERRGISQANTIEMRDLRKNQINHLDSSAAR